MSVSTMCIAFLFKKVCQENYKLSHNDVTCVLNFKVHLPPQQVLSAPGKNKQLLNRRQFLSRHRHHSLQSSKRLRSQPSEPQVKLPQRLWKSQHRRAQSCSLPRSQLRPNWQQRGLPASQVRQHPFRFLRLHRSALLWKRVVLRQHSNQQQESAVSYYSSS